MTQCLASFLGARRKRLEKAQHFSALAFFGPILWWSFCWFLGRNALKNQRKFQEIERNCRNISVLWNGRTKGSCWLSCVASKSPETSQNPRRAQMRAKKCNESSFPFWLYFFPGSAGSHFIQSCRSIKMGENDWWIRALIESTRFPKILPTDRAHGGRCKGKEKLNKRIEIQHFLPNPKIRKGPNREQPLEIVSLSNRESDPVQHFGTNGPRQPASRGGLCSARTVFKEFFNPTVWEARTVLNPHRYKVELMTVWLRGTKSGSKFPFFRP